MNPHYRFISTSPSLSGNLPGPPSTTEMTGTRTTPITLDRHQNGFTHSTTMVRGFPSRTSSHNVALTCPFSPEHYFDREAESNDPSFLNQSLTTLWSPSAEGVKVF